MRSIDLNCDMGEGFPNDELLMPFISSANIACGFHAGDEETMATTVRLALLYNVAVGAHPGFDDRPNFGRLEHSLSPGEIYQLFTTQLQKMNAVCTREDAPMHHVKPHGALYNMAAKNVLLANAIARAVFDFNPLLTLYGLSGSHSISEAKKLGMQTAAEVFADRTYQDDGSLTARTNENAMITSGETSLQEVLQMINQQSVTSVNGKLVPLDVQTVCLHCDGAHAVTFASSIHSALKAHAIEMHRP